MLWVCVLAVPQSGAECHVKVAGMQESTQTDHKHPQHQPHRAPAPQGSSARSPPPQPAGASGSVAAPPASPACPFSGFSIRNSRPKQEEEVWGWGGEVAGGAAAEGTRLLQVGVETGSEPQDVPCLVLFHAPHPHVLSCPPSLPAWAQNNSQGWH